MADDGGSVLFDELKRSRAFTGSLLRRFSEEFGERFWKALKAAVNGQVKRYVFQPSGRVEWVIVGKKRDYRLISDFYCGCDDFYLNVVVRKKNKYCYHIIAKVIAESIGTFETVTVEDSKYDIFMSEWDKIED